jgi:hypothetical protein
LKEKIRMSLLTSAAIIVGKEAAKSIFKFWVKDPGLGQDISSDFIDLIASRTEDELAQRKGNREFQDIGDKIAENLLPLLKSESLSLDEGERSEVARAVATTLSLARLTTEILLKHDLQPIQLENYLQNSNPSATKDLGSAGTSLYRRIIHECCLYIINISSQLPSFTESTFGEVLKREALIIGKVDEALAELRKISANLNLDDKTDQFEREYREEITRNLDVVQLIGADVSLPNRRHKLSVAYITLSLSQKLLVPLTTPPTSSDEATADEAASTIVSADIALAYAQRLLILGQAGSGKTTLLQWIAVKAATHSFPNSLASWNNYIPFYIRLRHYAQSKLPTPEAFPEFAAPFSMDIKPPDWVRNILHLGRAIILVDGVDEVSAAQREDVHTWLIDLVETYPRCQLIVTSRPHAIEEGWMNNKISNNATLQEMALEDIDAFIDHWHEAVKQELHTEEAKNELAPLAQHLKAQVKQIRPIRNLASNPLLCAMLCALNRDRRRQLPLNRVELYTACCSLLLERREKESRIDLRDYPPLSYSQKMRLLESLAYWMIHENLTETTVSIVDSRFSSKLTNMPNIPPDTTAAMTRRFFIERSGLIREPIVGQIDFAHRTFQEFLAARAALDVSDIAHLISNAHDDQYREVIILSAGLASQTQCDQLIQGLIQRGDQEKEHRYAIHLIAIACLETAIELSPSAKTEVEKRLAQLVPPKNMTEAKAMAAAGELAIKHLDKNRLEAKKKLSATVCAACVRTLSLIGGDAALHMLETYARDNRATVTTELLKAWESFDSATYAQKILLQTIQEPYLDLSGKGMTSLVGIEHLTHLTSLDLSWCDQLSDISSLASMSSLTTLGLHGCSQLSNISLANMSSLVDLDLNGCSQLSDISLTNMSSLTTLNLSYCIQLSNISLTNMSSLTTLNLSYCIQLSDLSPLANLNSLTTLNLSGCNQLSDLSPLANLNGLTSLNLHRCRQLSDLSPLASLSQLTI